MEVRVGRKEGWMPKNWCFRMWYWRRILRVPWKTRRSNLSILKEINPEYSLTGLGAEVEAPIIFWQPAVRNQLIGKDPGTGKDWGQEENVKTEDEMVGWLPRLNGHEFEQTLADGEGQGSLACCSPWGHKESDTTEQWIATTKCHCLDHSKFLVIL